VRSEKALLLDADKKLRGRGSLVLPLKRGR
jgi:hypothetical protein